MVKKRLGKSTFNTEKFLNLISEVNTEVMIPRGFSATLVQFCNREKIPYKIIDKRTKKEAINFASEITLQEHQEVALDKIREKDFGVIGSKGVVGVVATVSKHYSLVVSLLNKRIALSARLKKNNFFGTLKWNGEDYRYANLTEIPNHIQIGIGDTVVSSGFSAIFPENINLGVISDINNNKSNNFYDLKVQLLTDFKSIKNVYFIKNQQKNEQLNLEIVAKDEY